MIFHRMRWVTATSLCVATLCACLGGNAAAVASTAGVGDCRLTLGVTVHRLHGMTNSYRSAKGSAACTGRVGPWLMGGQTGWATSEGTIIGGTMAGNACLPTRGSGSLFAQAPRFAWFNPSMVTMSGKFRFHQVGGVLDLTWCWTPPVRLHKSPFASSFTISGSGTFSRATSHPWQRQELVWHADAGLGCADQLGTRNEIVALLLRSNSVDVAARLTPLDRPANQQPAQPGSPGGRGWLGEE